MSKICPMTGNTVLYLDCLECEDKMDCGKPRPAEERDELIDLIPKDKLDEVFKSPYCEIEPGYLCFDEVYKAFRDNTPKDMTIIDLGCYVGLQGFFFRDYAGYIGVDELPDTGADRLPDKYDGKIWMPRLGPDNSKFYVSSIQNFIKDFDSYGLDKSKCMAVMSYVPDKDAFNKADRFFPNFAAYYPGLHYERNPFRLNGAERDFAKMVAKYRKY